MLIKNLSLDESGLKLADKGRQFTGYASVFNGTDTYGDTILPGAFKHTLKNRARPVHMRWNHFGPVIGKWTSITEDDTGLRVEGELTSGHSVAEDAYALLKHGAIDGLSIGYFPVDVKELGDDRRELKKIELVEISIVESPADLGAKVSDIKAAIEQMQTLKDIERLLRESAGFTRSDALALVSRIKALVRGERESESSAAEIAAAFQRFTFPQSKLTTN